MTNMEHAYVLAAAAVRQRLKEQRPQDLEVLDDLRKRDVAVYSGTYDSVEEVLKRLRVPHRLDPAWPRLGRPKIAFANCCGTKNAKLGGIASEVEKGTWLVSSDWCLTSVVQTEFPGTVKKRAGRHTADEVVGVEPSLDSLWRDIVILGVDPQWWLEASSHTIDVVDTDRVQVEAASHQMLVKYDAPVVSARFDWGAGHVYHVVSHFWLKRSRTPDARYARPATDFLEQGMRLTPDGIERVLRETKIAATAVDFASLQSAATSTELIAQLCIQASN